MIQEVLDAMVAEVQNAGGVMPVADLLPTVDPRKTGVLNQAFALGRSTNQLRKRLQRVEGVLVHEAYIPSEGN